MSIPYGQVTNLATSATRTLVRVISYAGYQLSRRDHSGDIYPSDGPSGRVEGPAADRVVVIGEATAMGYGILTHELGLASQFARKLSARTGRGAEWTTVPVPGKLLRNAPQLIAELRDDIARADFVILVVGIEDTISLTSSTAWHRQLTATLDAIEDELSTDAVILVTAIPPLSEAGAIPAAVRWASAHQARLLNRVSAEVVATRPQCRTVPFPLGLDNQLWKVETAPAKYCSLYANWAVAILKAALPPVVART